MSVSAANAETFFREIVASQVVWTVEDDGGIPSPLNGDGERAMPFWSTEKRAQAVIANSPPFGLFRTRSIPLSEWVERWLPGIESDGLLAGLNWIGARARGYDLTPAQVLARLDHALGSADG